MKKFLAILLMLAMMSGTVLALADAEKFAGYYVPPAENPGQYPIENGGTLTYWMVINAGAANFISSYDENPAYQAIQKNTGVDIEFIHPAAGNTTEQFLTMLASGKIPDMILMNNQSWYTGGLQAMYDDGIIIDLTPYLEQYAPQYKEIVDSDEMCRKQATHDGKYLGMFKMTYAEKMPYNRFNTNKDWLDEAGMKEPKTIDEYEAFFDWILANKPDVAPVYFDINGAAEQTMNLTMGAFDFIYTFYLDQATGKVNHWSQAEGYKDWLELMNKWYSKGYLSKDFMSLTLTEAQAMFDGGKIGTIADSVDATWSRIKKLDENSYFQLTNLPYMRKEADSILGSNLANNRIGDGGEWVSVVTTACKNVEVAVQYLNYGYCYEGSLIFNWGIEGEAWNWGDEGLPVFTELMTNNPQGMTMSNVSYALKIHFGAKYCYPDAIASPAVASDKASYEIRTMWAGDIDHEQNFLQLPPINLTAEEAAERTDIMAQINTYAKEMMYKFITGAESLDNYDAYLAELKNLNIDRAIEITQDAVDRFNAK